MKKISFVLSILSVVGAFVVDLVLLDHPSIRNGWWSLLFFLVPLGFLVLAWSPEGKGKLGTVATVVVAAGFLGYLSERTVFGSISGTPAVAVGSKVPDFELLDQDGRSVQLSELTGRGRVLLVFFQTASCPHCLGQFRELMTREADFRYSRVSVVGVGRVTPEEAKRMELPFTILCDTDLEVARKYGLLHEKGHFFRDVARPTTILLDSDRTLRWMAASSHVRTRPGVEEIIDELRR